jgi:hypothetical protein
VHCIETNEAPLSGGPAGVDVVRVLEAIERSARNAGAVEAV